MKKIGLQEFIHNKNKERSGFFCNITKNKVVSMFLCVMTLMLTVQSVNVYAWQKDFPSGWALNEIAVAKQWGIFVFEWDSASYKSAAELEDVCDMLVQVTENILGEDFYIKNHSKNSKLDMFEDSFIYEKMSLAQLVDMNVINTTNKFYNVIIDMNKTGEYKDVELLRQDVWELIYNTLEYCKKSEKITASNAKKQLSQFTDLSVMNEQVISKVAFLVKNKIVSGSGTKLNPNDVCTLEQAIVMIKKSYEFFGERSKLMMSNIYSTPFSAPVLLTKSSDLAYNKDLIIEWEKVDGIKYYRVSVFSNRYEYEIFTMADTVFQFPYQLPGNDVLFFTVAGIDEGNNIITPFSSVAFRIVIPDVEIAPEQAYSPSIEINNNPQNPLPQETPNKASEVVDKFTFTSKEEAMLYMETVEIRIWRIDKNGNKYPDKTKIVVHRSVAKDVVILFDEIFNGAEQFPIKYVSGFDWRDNASEHCSGTAIDINPDENYYIRGDKILAGKFWNPNESIFSIPDNGDVVRAFKAKGWYWGGYGWSKTKDFMHFSFFGN